MTEVLPKSFAGKDHCDRGSHEFDAVTTLCDPFAKLEIVGMVVGHLFPAANLGKVSPGCRHCPTKCKPPFAFDFLCHQGTWSSIHVDASTSQSRPESSTAQTFGD